MQLVLPLKDWHFYRGDRVSLDGAGCVCGEVLTVTVIVSQVEIVKGKDAGKQGLVNAVIKQRNWVFVAGLNCVSCLGWGGLGLP